MTVGRRTDCFSQSVQPTGLQSNLQLSGQKGKLRHREGKGLGWDPADREGLEPRTPGPKAPPIAMGCCLHALLGSFAN